MQARPAKAPRIACIFALLGAGCDRDVQSNTGAANTDSGEHSVDSGTMQVGCIDVSHVDDRQQVELEVIGTGFLAEEGRVIRVVATHGEPNYALGEATIRAGEFDIELPIALGDYTGLGLYVDRIRNAACDPGDEMLWQITTGPGAALGPEISQHDGHPAWEVTPDTLRVFEQAGPCNINGIFDLTVPLLCTD